MSSIPGNPQAVATNGKYVVIKRGSSHYAVIEIGESISSIKKWKGRKLLSSMLLKGGYKRIDPPEDYTI